ncbi:MAG: hypothetical protein ABEJ71_02180 [Halodesulfurarchaeum sp.]
MSSSRSSELALAILVLLAVVAVPAAAVSVSGENVPDTVKVGEKQTTTFTLTDLFSSYEQWTLVGKTDLTQVNWQVTTYDNAGNQVNETTFTGSSFRYQLKAQSGVVRVEVRLVGTTPSVSNWSYRPAQKITYASFRQTQPGGASKVLTNYTARPYTESSQAARQAIEAASQAIQKARDAGLSVSEARADLQDAISFYESGNFQQARQNANRAKTKAQNALQSSRQTNTLLLVGAGVVVLLVIAGVVYWYLQQRESYDKLG